MKPSKKIGMILGNMEIINARTIITEKGTEKSQYEIKCIRCGETQWYNGATTLRGTAKCPKCDDVKYSRVKSGLSKKSPKLYSIYRGMKRRCYSEKCDKYPHYGGKGVTICDEWLNNFEAFVSWAMANGWDESKTIDRINVNGDYEPSNCRWVDQKTQVNNQTKNIHVDYDGRNLTLQQFCELTGANYDRARYLIFKKGMKADEAIRLMNLV